MESFSFRGEVNWWSTIGFIGEGLVYRWLGLVKDLSPIWNIGEGYPSLKRYGATPLHCAIGFELAGGAAGTIRGALRELEGATGALPLSKSRKFLCRFAASIHSHKVDTTKSGHRFPSENPAPEACPFCKSNTFWRRFASTMLLLIGPILLFFNILYYILCMVDL